jgi:CBS domain containing-hemolysin-like protein
VAAEFAAVAVDRSRLETAAAEGSRTAAVALYVHRHLSFHLSAAQLGLTISSLVLGFVAEPTLARVIEPGLEPLVGDRAARGTSIVLALAIATVLSMVVGELIPKNLVIASPLRSSLVLARPLRLFAVCLAPFIRLCNGTANWLVRRLGVEPQEELSSVRSLSELDSLIRSSAREGVLESEKLTLLTRSIRFGEKTAADVLVPRPDVVTVPADGTVGDLVDTALRSGLSRFPVIGGDVDDVVGVAHVKDVYGLPVEQRAASPLSAIATPAFAVPETRDLDELFDDLRRERTHLAVVVDEHGGTAGVVALEDLLEEIVGEIDDEYDLPAGPGSSRLGPNQWELSGTLHAGEVAELCGFSMPEGEYDTLAGFVLERLGHLPEPGERLDADGWAFEVTSMDRRRIASLRATKKP